jgi:hypothetical protein
MTHWIERPTLERSTKQKLLMKNVEYLVEQD